MNAGPKKSYPHVLLHALTGLIALAALALALYNFRWPEKSRQGALTGRAAAVLSGGAASVSSVSGKKSRGDDEVHSGKSARAKKKTAPGRATGKVPDRSTRIPPARSRGLDEIITDLVDSALN